MAHSQGESVRKSQSDFLRALRLTQWVVPVLMSVLGIAFVFFENSRHQDDPGWPWPTLFGWLFLGIFGPALSWICLRWASRSAEAYLFSQKELTRRAEELATLNTLSVAAGFSLDLDRTISTILEQTM